MARAGFTRQRLAWAAAELADEVGFDQVTASAVARQFGVAVASLYSHVSSSQQLRVEVTLLALAEMADRGDLALAGRAGIRHAQLMRSVLRGYDLTEPDQTHAVRLLGATFRGFVSQEMGGGFAHSAPDPQQSWTRVLTALDALLQSWPAP